MCVHATTYRCVGLGGGWSVELRWHKDGTAVCGQVGGTLDAGLQDAGRHVTHNVDVLQQAHKRHKVEESDCGKR